MAEAGTSTEQRAPTALVEAASAPPLEHPPGGPVEATGIRTNLETLARLAAVGITSVYVTGFLIITLHHAQYGIAQLNPLKPRVFSAGLLFVVLCCISVVAALGMFRIGGLWRNWLTFRSAPANSLYARLTLGFGFYYVAWFIAGMATWSLIATTKSESAHWYGVVMSVGAVFLFNITSTQVLPQLFDKRPRACTLVVFLVTLTVFISNLRFASSELFWLSVWIYITGIEGVLLYYMFEDRKFWKRAEWETALLGFLALPLVLFATDIYGTIKFSWGGAEPVPVVLHFAEKPLPWIGATTECQLLEETDHGYYVLLPGSQKKAYFVRRDLVKMIHFKSVPSGR